MTGSPTARARVAVVVSGWPRVSEVFAQNEIRALQQAGMLAGVWATKHGETGPAQPAVAELAPWVEVLPDGDAPAQAAHLARAVVAAGATGVHGYFAHHPAAVAAGAARVAGLPFGFSVHALDARRVGDAELVARSRDAAVVVCCNEDVATHLRGAARPQLVRHGVDLDLFPVHDPDERPGPLRLLAVGRLVPKKGLDVLLEAVSRVRVPVRLRLAGTGPLEDDLRRQVDRLGLGDRVELLGRRTHADLPDLYAWSQVVVVPSVVDAQGDRDGLPNVVLEAMASGRPVVASEVAAVPAAVEHEVTGLLVPPGDPGRLAEAVERYAASPALRRTTGAAGRARAVRDFSLSARTAHFCRVLEESYA